MGPEMQGPPQAKNIDLVAEMRGGLGWWGRAVAGEVQGRQELRCRLCNLFGLSMQRMYDNLCRSSLALAAKLQTSEEDVILTWL